mgnify:CR=1 FL=1|jgi:conserved inner membrane protein
MLPLSRLWQLIPPTLAAVLCMYLAALPPLAQNGISPLTLAIVLGMALGNSVAAPHLPRIAEGIAFSKGRLLRLGIVLYGFKITWAQLTFAGWPALFADVGVVCGTFALALWLGRRLDIDRDTAALVGAGSAICGAAAVLAAQPVLKAKEADVGVAVATVVVFGTLAMFVYPLLAALLLPSVADADACFGWGIYTGASVHEVAQVADVAVITKMIRVLLLAPFLLALPWLMRRFGGGAPAAQKGAPALPWFALGFLGAVAANSPLLLAGMLALWLLLGGGTLSYLALRLFA